MLAILIVQLTACAPQKVTVRSTPGFDPSAIDTIAVLPFQALTTPQEPTAVPLDTISAPEEVRSQFRLPDAGGRGAKAKPITVPSLAAQKITEMVHATIENRPGLNVLPLDRVKQALPEVGPERPPLKLSEKVKRIGETLRVDAVLVGLVRTYREREGTKIAAIPAAVGFEVHLVNPINGLVLWTGEYYEEQKPLNEDLIGFLERWGTFVTAEALAEYGVHKVMKKFPLGLS